MQAELSINSRLLDLAEVDEFMPDLNTEGVAGVCYEPHGGYADPVQSTEAYLDAFERLGGEVRLNTPARALARDRDRITGVLVDDGPVAAGTVVNAAGPWAKPLAQSVHLDLKLTVTRELETVWQACPGRPIPRTSVSNAVDAIYLRPSGKGRFIIGRGFPKSYEEVDPYNYKQTVEDDFIADVHQRAERRFPALASMQCIASDAALYDVSPDWYPITGPRSGLDGYADACGGSGHGFKIAPALGRALARSIVNGAVDGEFPALAHDRFEAGATFVQVYGGNRG